MLIIPEIETVVILVTRQTSASAPLDEWAATLDDADRRARRKILLQDGSGGKRVMPSRYADDGEVEHDA